MLPIIARQVVVPAADYLAVNSKLINTFPAVQRLRKWAWVILIISSVGLTLNLWQRPPNSIGNVVFFGALMLATSSYFLFGKAVISKNLMSTYLKANFPAKYPTDYIFTDEWISGHNDLNDFTAKWAVIQKAELINQWLLLYLSERTCHWIDLKQLEAPATYANLKQVLTAHHIQVKELAS